MAFFTNPSIKIIKALAAAGIAVLIANAASGAANLKDIRIGEYDAFTRIVFEFDQHIASHTVTYPRPHDLEIMFTGTLPAFKRRIPVERSRRIEALHIWMKKDGVSAAIHFSDSQLRFETITFNAPYRIALDVYTTIGDSHTIPPMKSEESPPPPDKSLEQSVYPTHQEPPTESNARTDNENNIKTLEGIDRPKAASPQFQAKKTTQPEKASFVESSQAVDAPPPSVITQSAGNDMPVSNGKIGLQYYLVIILVIITIVILALLVIMLLSKNRWSQEKNAIDVGEFLNHQDERIAAINARIQEQLKRYDEA